jgi:4-hydroxy-2-oxoheptanedioate aldolase
MNTLLKHLTEHSMTWVVNIGGASVDRVDMLAAAGVKCLFIDCERTAIHIESVRPLVLAAKSYGMFTMLRTENQQEETLVRYLDRGVDAIVVPHTESVEQLKMISQVVDYVSKGKRDQFMTIAQIESQQAVSNIESMVSTDYVDSFLIGPNDLSHSMGFKGNLDIKDLWQTIDEVILKLNHHQRVWGIPGQPESLSQFSQKGAKYLYTTLQQVIQQGFKSYQSIN